MYKYAEDPKFKILLFGVSVDDGPVRVYDLTAGEEIPSDILVALQDPAVEKWAFNAMFERVCLSRYLWDRRLLTKGIFLSPQGWQCSMIWSGYMGFPMSLAGAGAALGLEPLVSAWRTANPRIVQFWWAVDKAVKDAIKNKGIEKTHSLAFEYRGAMLYITLPSGRQLSYVKPRIGENRFGGESVTYMGIDTTKHWSRIESYGPKFVENIVQGISRDILCHAMEKLRDYRIVAHVHDEVIIEAPPEATVDEICSLMATVPSWAQGLILRADGYECKDGFYMKD